jgi:hypothetical protein
MKNDNSDKGALVAFLVVLVLLIVGAGLGIDLVGATLAP